MANASAKNSERKTSEGVGGKGTQKAAVVFAAVAAAAAAGTYFFAGKRGRANRRAIRGWTVRAKGEVMQKLEQLQEVSLESYMGIVDAVLKGYRGLKDITPDELDDLKQELQSSWKDIESSLRKKKPTSSAKTSASSKSSQGKKK